MHVHVSQCAHCMVNSRVRCVLFTMVFRNVVVAFTCQKKVQAKASSSFKAEDRTKREKGKEGAYPQSGLSVVGASSAIRPDGPHGQRSASLTGRDSVVCSPESVVRASC